MNVITKYLECYLSASVIFLLDMIGSLAASFVTLAVTDVVASENLMTMEPMSVWMLSSLVFSFVLIWTVGTYKVVVRHMAFKGLGRFVAVAFYKVVMTGLVYGGIIGFSSTLYVMMLGDFFLTCAAFFMLRMTMLMAYEIVKRRADYRKNCMNVLVYGTGDKSVSLIGRLQNSRHYKVVGIICYGGADADQVLSETEVYPVSGERQFQRVLDETGAEGILFAADQQAREEKDRLVKFAVDRKVRLLFAPPIDEVVDGRFSHRLRNIEIEDLLMRPEIKISMEEIMADFRGKTVMVTGAAGSIGSELCRQLASFGIKVLILFDNAETPMHNLRLELEERYPDLNFVPIIGDVRLRARIDHAFRNWHPQIVFHAAAYKHVPLMETNPCEAVLVNVAGSRNVADKCIEYDVEKMVMVSTDKAVNPTNIMGCTKRLAEIYVQSMGLAVEYGLKAGKTRFVTTRFGNVLGSNGSVIPRFRDQIAKGGPVTVTHPEITRFFMTIPEACSLVMEAAAMSTGNQIYVFDMGESVKIDDLARRMIQLAGYTPDEDIKVEYSGLRPGEKLYEEVLSDKENTIPTDHSRIRIAKVRQYPYDEAVSVVDELERLSRDVDVPAMVRVMKKTVPEFVSRNSIFERYDR